MDTLKARLHARSNLLLEPEVLVIYSLLANVKGDARREETSVQQGSFSPSHPPACSLLRLMGEAGLLKGTRAIGKSVSYSADQERLLREIAERLALPSEGLAVAPQESQRHMSDQTRPSKPPQL